MEEYTRIFRPLVFATAARYMGRGAEREDLIQEGYLALLILIPKCPDFRYLAGYLTERVPGYVRDAARRMRCARGSEEDPVPLDDIEDIVGARDSNHAYSAADIRDMLRRALTEDELDLTQALMEGFTQSEIAAIKGVSQQAVNKRLKKVRKKLEEVIGAL